METRTPRGSFIIRTLLGNFIFVFFCSTLLSFAQAQQPMVVIDFKDFSAAFWPYRASPGLQVLSANFSGGVLISGLLPDFQNTFYVTASGCDGCLPTITINFNQPVSNFSVLLMNATRSGEIYTINDDQGGQQQVILAPYGQPGEVRTASLPESKIRQVTISGNGCFGIDYVQFRPSGPVLLDPVDSGYLTGPQVTTNTTQLSQGGIIVQGAAADGVTQAVVRIPANSPGESLSVAVQNEIGNQDTVVNDGGLFALGGSPQSAASALNVTAVDTPNGPMAFVIYLSPLNFARPPQQYPNDST